MHFNKILRNLIEDKDLTQKQVAKDLGFAPSTLGGYVQGTSEPDYETLISIAKYFDVSTDYLLGVPSGSSSFYESEILRLTHSMSISQQELYINIGKAIIKTNNQ